MGKSNLLESRIFESIWSRNRAVVYIDPHGENAERLLDRLPQSDIKRTCYLNFNDYHYPVGFDPLEYGAHHCLTGFLSIWVEDTNKTPRMRSILRHVLLLIEDNHGTLSDIPKVIHQPDDYLNKARPYLRRWFNTTFRDYQKDKSNPFSAVLNKTEEIPAMGLDRFLCQNNPKFSFEDFLTNHGILIVNLSKATLGDDAAAIAGALLTTTLRAALLKTPSLCDLYADEFPTYGTSLFASMLSEMRKFGLSITLALQFLSQIHNQTLRDSILANTTRKTYFRLQPDDAQLLAKQYETGWSDLANQLMNLEPFQIYDNGTLGRTELFDRPSGRLHDVRKHTRTHIAQQF